jgi:hypothetical protein
MLAGYVDRIVVEELAVCKSASSPAKAVNAMLATQIQPHSLLRKMMVTMD